MHDMLVGAVSALVHIYYTSKTKVILVLIVIDSYLTFKYYHFSHLLQLVIEKRLFKKS